MDPISASSGMSYTSMRMPQSMSLSDDQIAVAQEIISQYNADEVTEESAAAMKEELDNAGIGAGEDLKGILEDAGFEVKAPEDGGQQGGGPQGSGGPEGVGGPPPPPPSGEVSDEESSDDEDEEDSEEQSAIQEFMEKYESGDLDDEDVTTLIDMLRANGQDTTGIIVNDEG